MKEINLLQRKIESAKGFRNKALDIENETHAFIWEALDSICGEEPLIEKEITLYSPGDQKFSLKDLYIREILRLRNQEESIDLLVSIRKSFDLSAFSVEAETQERKVADRKSIIFQITKHGTKEKPIWGTKMFIGGIERGEEISTEFNQANKSFERLEKGFHLLNFISN